MSAFIPSSRNFGSRFGYLMSTGSNFAVGIGLMWVLVSEKCCIWYDGVQFFKDTLGW